MVAKFLDHNNRELKQRRRRRQRERQKCHRLDKQNNKKKMYVYGQDFYPSGLCKWQAPIVFLLVYHNPIIFAVPSKVDLGILVRL